MATIKRRFRIINVSAIAFAGATPNTPTPGIMVQVEPYEDDPTKPMAAAAPEGMKFPFVDPDGSVANDLVTNRIIEVTFALAPKAGAS